MSKFNKIYIVILLLLVVIVVSLGSILIYSKITTDNKYSSDNDIIKTSNDVTTESIHDDSLSDTNQNVSDSDSKMINYFNKCKDELGEYVNEENWDKLKGKGKEYFIIMTDFLFYGEDINGVYLSEISDGTKSVLFSIFGSVDSLIIRYYPNYKDTLLDKYSIVKDVAGSTYDKTMNKIEEIIGSDKYNAIGEAKDNVKEKTKDTYESAKDKVSTWYQGIKE